MLGDYQLLVRHAQRLKSSTSLSMVSASDFETSEQSPEFAFSHSSRNSSSAASSERHRHRSFASCALMPSTVGRARRAILNFTHSFRNDSSSASSARMAALCAVPYSRSPALPIRQIPALRCCIRSQGACKYFPIVHIRAHVGSRRLYGDPCNVPAEIPG